MTRKRAQLGFALGALLGTGAGCIEITGLGDVEYVRCLSDSDCGARECVRSRCVARVDAGAPGGAGGVVGYGSIAGTNASPRSGEDGGRASAGANTFVVDGGGVDGGGSGPTPSGLGAIGCTSKVDGSQLQIPLKLAVGIGISLTDEPHSFQLYVSSNDDWTVAERRGWSVGTLASSGSPTPWACFDGVSGAPRRIAATNLNDGTPEVYLTTESGELYSRNYSGRAGWQPWTESRVPSNGSNATDVAVSSGRGRYEHVYLIDNHEVFVRHREDPAPQAPYTDWRSLGNIGGEVVAVSVLRDGRQMVLSTSEDGVPLAALQSEQDTPGAFEPWSDFGGHGLPPIVEIEGGAAPGGNAIVFAADELGRLWTREELAEATFGEWQPWDGPTQPDGLGVLASTWMGLYGITALVGVTREGKVVMTIGRADGWDGWVSLDG